MLLTEKKRLKLTASGATLGCIDRHYREQYKYIDNKTIIITKTKKREQQKVYTCCGTIAGVQYNKL